MASKSVALIGPGTGPKVRTGGRKARVQVRGLREGEEAFVVQHGGEELTLRVPGDGIYMLASCEFAKVSYEGKNRGFIACILLGG